MSQGYLNVVVQAKEGAYDTIDNITKFALSEDDYEIIKEWIEPPISSILNNQITTLKKQLTDTDYVVIKIAEGVAVKEDYAEVLVQRQQWRAEINRLEAELALAEE